MRPGVSEAPTASQAFGRRGPGALLTPVPGRLQRGVLFNPSTPSPTPP